ncbi:MAG: FGGY-family carbohydrate kinase [Gammaproteobacteria bacterium]
MGALFIGIDFGTSGCRSSVIDEQAREVHGESLSLPAPERDAQGSSQDPLIWWEALLELLRRTVRAVDGAEVRSIALDGTSGTLLLTDAQGGPLTPALMYNDARSTLEAGRISAMAGEDCAAASPTSSLAKLLWLLANEPCGKASHALHQADWLSNRLCGQYGISDENNALKLGYDPIHRCWPDWLTSDGALRSLLPEVLPPSTEMGSLRPELARELGLNSQTRIITGTTDSTAAFIATGACRPGDAVTSLGTTLVIKVLAETPIVDMARGIYSHRLGDRWIVGGASNSGGGVLRHYFSDAQISELTQHINPEQTTGLDYYPLLTNGERFPVNDAELAPRLSPRPTSDSLFLQGMLEGIAGIERAGYQALAELGAPYPDRVITTGGGSVSTPWRLIREACLGRPCPASTQSTAAYGSALLARHGEGGDGLALEVNQI